MLFANFSAIHLFWVVAAAAVFLFWSYVRRIKLLRRFAMEEVLPQHILSFSLKKYKIKAVLLLLALIFLTLTLMQPQGGFHWQEVKRQGVDILIAVDVSKSMLAQDVLPNRLERAKFAIRDLIPKLQGDRIGLIAFAGTSFLQCPLTMDYQGFLLSLDELDVNTIPRGGTSIASAIQEALRGYEGGEKKYKVLVIITDGEDHEGDLAQAAEKAKDAGIRIFCIGVGTEEGELIPVTVAQGGREFVKDKEGNVIKSHLNEEPLKEIAVKTDGAYVRATALDFGLSLLYEKKIASMEKRVLKSTMARQYEERFQIPLFVAFIILVMESLITTYKHEF